MPDFVNVDYSLYYVTGRDQLPPGKDYLESLEEALQGGVSIVQIREKTVDTREFLDIARFSREVCDKYNVPLIINDRVDIALAVGAAGVHVGQEDMPASVVRALLPPGSIIGVSCHNVAHAQEAVDSGHVDYIGIGTIFDTSTKATAEGKLIGPRVAARIVDVLRGSNVKSVAIGGIKANNALRVLWGTVSSNHHALDGLAVVSDIAVSMEPRQRAEKLVSIIKAFKAGQQAAAIPGSLAVRNAYTIEAVLEASGQLLRDIRRLRPVVHQITNNVVMNQSANATLALGASPIMATAWQEMEDLARLPGALLINFGTITDKRGMLDAGFWANVNKKPVVFDPVGVGATAHRRASAKELLDRFQVAVIKGNAAEIGALAGLADVSSKGVDSEGVFADPASVIKRLALQERCVVVMTGATDYVTDGHTTLALANGHPLLGAITGSGCMVGTAVATFLGGAHMASGGAAPAQLFGGDALLAAAAAVLVVTIASERAAAGANVRGLGTFLPTLLDELAAMTPEVLRDAAKIDVL